MLTLPAPPPFATTVRSDDPDEVTSWMVARHGHHSRVIHGTGRYGFEASSLTGRLVALSWGRTAKENTLRGCFRSATVHVPRSCGQRYAFGRRAMEVQPGQPVFLPPGADVGRRGGPGEMFAVTVEPIALAHELQSRGADASSTWPLYPLPLLLTDTARLAAQAAIGRFMLAFGSGAFSRLSEHCEATVIALIADILGTVAGRASAGPVTARRLADLESWIDDHLPEPMTIGRLCQVAGVGERSLQLAFQNRRGMSPMRFVVERRLAAAHHRLSKLEESGDVTSIAHDLGFTHLGRFSQAYREKFGETPSLTRARRRPRDPAYQPS